MYHGPRGVPRPWGVPWPSRGVPWPLYEEYGLELLYYLYLHCDETTCCVISGNKDADCSFFYLLNPLVSSFPWIAIRLWFVTCFLIRSWAEYQPKTAIDSCNSPVFESSRVNSANPDFSQFLYSYLKLGGLHRAVEIGRHKALLFLN